MSVKPSGLPAAEALDGTELIVLSQIVSSLLTSVQATTGDLVDLFNPMTTAGDLIVGGTAGAAERLAKGADGKVLGVVAGALAWVERRRKIVALGNITGAVDIDLSSGDIITATLTGNVTLSWVNLPPAGYVADIELRLTQDGTGSRTATWPASGKWPGGSAFVLTPTVGATDIVGLTVDSAAAWIGYPVEAVA